MRSWFDSLQTREQAAVMIAGVFLTFAIVYFAVWSPLDRGQSTMRDSVSTLQRSLAELKTLKNVMRNPATAGASQLGAGQSLVVIVDSTLGQRNLSEALQRSQPTGANGIRVEFKDAAFDDLIGWLGDLSNRYGMQVQSANFSVSAQSIPGRVNASLTIER